MNLLDISNNFLDPHTLNIITTNNSSNLIYPHPSLDIILSGLNYDPSRNAAPPHPMASRIRDPNDISFILNKILMKKN